MAKQSSSSTEETFSVNGAAKLTGYSVPTIRKRLPELKRAGAVMAGDSWAIPLSALHSAGLMAKIESKGDLETTRQVTGQTFYPVTGQEIEALRGQLAEAERRAAVAEAIAAERLQALERADRALLMLEAAASASESPSKPRRGLFSRRR